MLPDAFLAHVSPGRIRVKVPGKKGDAAYFTRVCDALRGMSGLTSLRLNAVTGSVVIEGSVGLPDLYARAEAMGLFMLSGAPLPAEPMGRRLADGLRDVDKVVLEVSSGQFGLPGAVFLGLAATGIYQLSVGNIAAPAWYTAFWYALGVYSKFLNDS